MSKEAYQSFKRLRLFNDVSRLYLLESDRKSPENFIEERWKEIEDTEIANPGCDLTRLKEEIKVFQKELVIESKIVNKTAVVIRELMNGGQVLEDAYQCACNFFLGDAFFSIPVYPELRPEEFSAEQPITIPLHQIDQYEISTSSGMTRHLSDLFRGVSSTRFSNISPLIRPSSDSSDRAASEKINERLGNLSDFQNYLHKEFAAYEEIFGTEDSVINSLELSFAQHFKGEACLFPPMLDFTFDPLVALYFATISPKEGDVGVVYRLSVNADFMSMSNFRSIGNLSLIFLPGIKRLQRQRGVLLENPMSDNVDQLVPFSLCFKQHNDIRFIDEELGISDEILLEEDDESIAFCERFKEFRKSAKTFHSKSKYSGYTTESDLYRDILSYVSSIGASVLKNSQKRALKSLAKLHVKLEKDPKIPPACYSIRTLVGVIERVVSCKVEDYYHSFRAEYVGRRTNEEQGPILAHLNSVLLDKEKTS